jgi:hypothetical protein
MSDRQQFREYYGRLADDELARIALSNHLVPEAQEALTDEMQKRGLTDLTEYKRALDEAAAASSPERQLEITAGMKRELTEWVLVFMAWVLALVLPFAWLASPNRSDAFQFTLMATPFIAVSCYLGIKARREGSRREYFLKVTLPLVLLGISTLVALSVPFWRS